MFVKGDTVLFSDRVSFSEEELGCDINFVPEIRGRIRLFFNASNGYRNCLLNFYENNALIFQSPFDDTETVREIDVKQGANYIIRITRTSARGNEAIYLTAKADVKQIGYFAHSITKKEVS